MKTIEFQDMSQNNIIVQHSSGGDIRLYMNNKLEESPCLLLNQYQAKILINAIEDLLNE